MIRDEFIKTAGLTYKSVTKMVGGAGDPGGDLIDKAFDGLSKKRKKPGFWDKAKEGYKNQKDKVKQKAGKATGAAAATATNAAEKTTGTAANVAKKAPGVAWKGIKGAGNVAGGIGAAGLFGITAATNNLSDATTNAFNPNR